MPCKIKLNQKTGLWEIVKKATNRVVRRSAAKAKAKAGVKLDMQENQNE